MQQRPDRWREVMVTAVLIAQIASALAPAACLAQAGSLPASARPAREKTAHAAKESKSAASLDSGQKKSSKKLWFVVGGAAVVGLAVALAGGGGKDTKKVPPLDGFPATP
jgi:hypothetical protein